MHMHVNNILSHMHEMTSNFAKKYTLMKSSDGKVSQSYTRAFGDYIYVLECHYEDQNYFSCIHNGDALIEYVVDLGCNDFDEDQIRYTFRGTNLKDFIASSNKPNEWDLVIGAMATFFESNKEYMISRRSTDVCPHFRSDKLELELKAISELNPKYPKEDMVALLGKAFEIYSTFAQEPYAPSKYQIEETVGNLKIYIAYEEKNGVRDGFDMLIVYVQNRMTIELVSLFYSVERNDYVTVSRAASPISIGFVEGFAKFKLLGSLMS